MAISIWNAPQASQLYLRYGGTATVCSIHRQFCQFGAHQLQNCDRPFSGAGIWIAPAEFTNIHSHSQKSSQNSMRPIFTSMSLVHATKLNPNYRTYGDTVYITRDHAAKFQRQIHTHSTESNRQVCRFRSGGIHTACVASVTAWWMGALSPSIRRPTATALERAWGGVRFGMTYFVCRDHFGDIRALHVASRAGSAGIDTHGLLYC